MSTSREILVEMSAFLGAKTGLHFAEDRWNDLERGLREAALEFQFSSLEPFARWLLTSNLAGAQLNILASKWTVGETYFFRDHRFFEVLETQILPELACSNRAAKRLRFWSAGCCSGEEPFSLAISLRRALPDFANWQTTILGTDINPHFLRKATRGLFSEWSFRRAPLWLKAQFFQPKPGGCWQIDREIRQSVTFSELNLAEDIYPSPHNSTDAMDLICCRNVLIYFSSEEASRVLRRLHRCLKVGGWLVLSPGETAPDTISEWEPVNRDGVLLYRKPDPKTLIRAAQPPNEESETFSLPANFVFPDDVHAQSSDPSPPLEIANTSNSAEPIEAPRALLERARFHFEQRHYAEVVEILQEHLFQAPADTDSLLLLARALANQGQLSPALTWVERAVAMDKLNPLTHYLHANILFELGTLDESVSALRRLLYLDPDFVLAHYLLGHIARSQREKAEAARHFANALALVRQHPQPQVLPEADGLTAGRLAEIISSLLAEEYEFSPT
ncbi:MAG: CheR family methyltransferase [Verrucomicrobiota bacterium]